MQKLFGKRKRDDDHGKIKDAIAAVLDKALAWRDPCGKVYRVMHRSSVVDDRATVELGR